MIRSSLLAAVALAASLFAAGCNTMTAAESAPPLPGTAWVLSSLGGQAPLAGTPVTMQFEDGVVAGSDGCNRYRNTFTAQGGKVELGSRGASTMMACPTPVMKQAEAFTAVLGKAKGYRVSGATLELLGADGAVLATFAAQSQSLAGTSWKVTSFNNGRQAVVSAISGTDLTMAFSEDGRVAGSSGCNRYNAAYTQDGRKLAFGPAAATRMACATPEGVMEQEQQFLKALGTVATARVEGDRVEMRTADDALAMMLVKAK
jgi:heat shock protein HslJ